MIVIAVFLQFFFLSSYFNELDRHVNERAKLLASQLGSSSEYGVVSNNQPFLQNLVQTVAKQEDVRGVVILNSSSRLLAEAGNFSDAEKSALLATKQTIPANLAPSLQYLGEDLLVFQSIIPQTVKLDELEASPVATPIGTIVLKISLVRTNKIKLNESIYALVATAIFLALTGYVVNLTSRRIIYPINKLSEAILKIGQGNLEERASIDTNLTELGVLSNGIDLMAEQLQHERSVLQHRIEEATLSIIKSKEKAEEATLSKSRFLAAASHDLRQPMHTLGLFLDVLLRTELSAHQQELLANARSASDASNEMINTLLDYSRIEAGIIKPVLRPFRLQPLLNKIENELAPLADKKGLVYRTRETLLVVQSDPALVEVILRNLVSNAIRYTRHGGVLVACRRHGERALLEVWDTGIGINSEHQSEVFLEFHQLGNSERNSDNGLGLGLAIAQRLTQTLKDDLSLSSIPGRGSVFRFNLPIISIALSDELIEPPANLLQPLKARVLVIDDDRTTLNGMCQLLSTWGCICDPAESIEEALIWADKQAPDMVISDYRLREMRTGIEAIFAIRAKLGTNLPAMLITGDISSNLMLEAQARDIPVLHKPVSTRQFYRLVVDALK
jgi:signal transduction histidine kinase